jgi:Na+/melibiose symporter-like transporter
LPLPSLKIVDRGSCYYGDTNTSMGAFSSGVAGSVGVVWQLLLAARFTPDNAQKWLRASAFGAAMLASSAMNNVFVTYNGDFFKNVAKVPPSWFIFGQLVYLLFNASNDTIFGWISDKLPVKASSKEGSTISTSLLRRQRALRWGGFAWALAFALAWFPWASGNTSVGAAPSASGNVIAYAPPWYDSALRGLHFLFALCAYDGALTFVELNHAAVLAEMTRNSAERADANMMSAIGAAIGSFTSILAHVFYDRQDMTAFRVMSVVIAVVSIVVFEFSATGVAWDGKALKASLAAANDVKTMPTVVMAVAASAPPASIRTNTKTSISSNSSVKQSPKATEVVMMMMPSSSSSSPSAASIELVSFPSTSTADDDNSQSAIVPASSTAAAPSILLGTRRQSKPFPVSSKRGRTTTAGTATKSVGYLVFLRQLLSSRNVLVFVALSTIQTFDCSFEKGFFAPLSDIVVAAADAKIRLADSAGSGSLSSAGSLLGGPAGIPPPSSLLLEQGQQQQLQHSSPLGDGVVSKHTRSIIISLSFLLPHILTLVWTPLVTGLGMHRTIITILVLRGLLLGGAGFIHGLEPSQSAVSASTALGFMLMNRVLSESVCRLSPLILSDLIDEDTVLHRRAHTLSASVVGTAAMFSKASQSLAPLVAYHVLPDDLGHLLSIAPLSGEDDGSSSNSPGHGRNAAATTNKPASDEGGGLEGLIEREILKAASIVERGEERALDELMPLEGVEEVAEAEEKALKKGSNNNKQKEGGEETDADQLMDETVVKAVLPNFDSAAAAPPATTTKNGRKAAVAAVLSASAYRAQLEERAKPLFKASTRVWTLLLVLPSVAVFLQLAVWTRGYTLHGKRLAKIKAEADALVATTATTSTGSPTASSSPPAEEGNDDDEEAATGGGHVGTAAATTRRRAGHGEGAGGTAGAAVIAL